MDLSSKDIPWPAIVSGLVGIAGTLGGAWLTGLAAERRQQRVQQHEDRTGFHK